MKKIIIIAWGNTLMLAYAANAPFVDSSLTSIDMGRPYLIEGTISEKELNDDHIKFLESHPEYHEEQELIKSQGSTVPQYIKFIKYTPNPNFKPPSIPDNFKITLNYPASRELRLISPVLDQGDFNTCVTFATLGAISQQLFWYPSAPSPSCTLQMLKTNGQDAWNGYWESYLLNYLKSYGWISEISGQSGYCNANYVTYYPYGSVDQENASLYPSLSDYGKNSNKLTDHHINYALSPRDTLYYIKQELNDSTYSMVNGTPGFFPVFSFNEANSPYWFTASNGNSYLTWVNFGYPRNNVGHEIFAYGYDDNLSVNGQKGVLFLRNSWGDNGSGGNYLMTYDYFYNYYNNDYIVSFPYLNDVTIKD